MYFSNCKHILERVRRRCATNPNVPVRSQSSGSVLSSVIFKSSVKGNDGEIKQSVSRLVIKAHRHSEKNESRTDGLEML
jgi:hypothetical protein